MSAQINRDQRFPAACKRCGGVLYQHVDYCPYCGTDRPLDTVALGTHPKATFSALGPAAAAPPVPAAAKLWPAGLPPSDEAPATPDHQHASSLSHALPLPQVRRWIFPRGVFLVGFLLAIAYGVYMLFGMNRERQGTVSEQTLHASSGSVSPYSPQQQMDVTPPNAQTGVQPGASKPRAEPQFTDVADSLRVARTSLAENNLFDAKAAVNAALTRDAGNEEARAVQRDIAAREQRRDSALQNAEQCATQRAWACVQQQASEALAIDSSSVDARSMMERAILATAWKPLNPPPSSPSLPGSTKHARGAAAAPLPHAAGTVRLPSSQDWESATPPPLPDVTNATSATTTTTATTNTAPATPGEVSNDNGVDAQERAIVQNGWKPTAPPGVAH
ncbi:hypothetical protein ACLKMY_14710 [Paraburkholderia mimosarum]|uniref:hypothetical protein n=2 Tax=Paraburkholderia mimosarum TaxID=312026 RepID=UPI0039C46062